MFKELNIIIESLEKDRQGNTEDRTKRSNIENRLFDCLDHSKMLVSEAGEDYQTALEKLICSQEKIIYYFRDKK